MATKSDRNLSFPERVLTEPNPSALVNIGTSLGSIHPIDSANALMTSSLRKQLDDSIAKSQMKTEAVKYDEGKVDWSLIPFEALEEMVKVLEFGAKKYDRWNWTTNGGFKWTRVAASGMRHLFAWLRGEDKDPESGLSHIAHCQCNLLFLAYYIKHKNSMTKDDRNV